MKTRRIYYSAFEPIPGTPLEDERPKSRCREHRLYQGSFLIQTYGFMSRDFVLDDSDMLHLRADTKILTARPRTLIMVPGIGVKIARAPRTCYTRPIDIVLY